MRQASKVDVRRHVLWARRGPLSCNAVIRIDQACSTAMLNKASLRLSIECEHLGQAGYTLKIWKSEKQPSMAQP